MDAPVCCGRGGVALSRRSSHASSRSRPGRPGRLSADQSAADAQPVAGAERDSEPYKRAERFARSYSRADAFAHARTKRCPHGDRSSEPGSDTERGTNAAAVHLGRFERRSHSGRGAVHRRTFAIIALNPTFGAGGKEYQYADDSMRAQAVAIRLAAQGLGTHPLVLAYVGFSGAGHAAAYRMDASKPADCQQVPMNIQQADCRAWWDSGVSTLIAYGSFDGVFIDGARTVPKQNGTPEDMAKIALFGGLQTLSPLAVTIINGDADNFFGAGMDRSSAGTSRSRSTSQPAAGSRTRIRRAIRRRRRISGISRRLTRSAPQAKSRSRNSGRMAFVCLPAPNAEYVWRSCMVGRARGARGRAERLCVILGRL